MTTKKKIKKQNPRVILFVEGGVVHEVHSDQSVDLIIVDYDIEGGDALNTAKLRCMNGEWEEAYIHRELPCIKSKKVVDHYWRQLAEEKK
jgi:hypothetical protein